MALYGDVVLERFRHPRHFGELSAPDAAHEDVNPLCGDRLRVEIQLSGEPGAPIEAVRFQGDACAIAIASADLLAELVDIGYDDLKVFKRIQPWMREERTASAKR